jgi:hypothetical protein
MDKFFEFLPLIVMFLAIPYIVKLSLDHKLRQKLIDKGALDENTKYLFAENLGRRDRSSLKWGLVTIGIGLAFLIGIYAPEEYNSELTIALIFTFAGVGLILFHLIDGRRDKNSQS